MCGENRVSHTSRGKQAVGLDREVQQGFLFKMVSAYSSLCSRSKIVSNIGKQQTDSPVPTPGQEGGVWTRGRWQDTPGDRWEALCMGSAGPRPSSVPTPAVLMSTFQKIKQNAT